MRTSSYLLFIYLAILVSLSYGLLGVNPLIELGKFVLGIKPGTHLNNVTAVPVRVPVRLQIPTLEEVEYYLSFSAATYCSGSPLSTWTCEECNATESTVEGVKLITGTDWAGTQGMITIDHTSKEIVIAYRGTMNPINMVQDIKYDRVPAPHGPPGVEIHKGFLEATDSVYPEVLDVVKGLLSPNPEYSIVLTGHSLGGSMAVITYYKFSHDLPPNINYSLYTYGEPRTGNQGLADWVNSKTIKLARVVNEGDIVPHAALAGIGFAHHQTEFWTHNNETRLCTNREVYEDPSCSNSLAEDELSTLDHLNYLGVSIGFNCKEENPLGNLWDSTLG